MCMETTATLKKILAELDLAEDLYEPARKFPARRRALAKFRAWADAHPAELVEAAPEIEPNYLRRIERDDLIAPKQAADYVSNPDSHYNRALRMED